MTQTETQAIVTLSLMAAFVDGDKHDRERAEVRRIAEGLAQSDAVHLPTLVQDVLMKRVDLAGTAAALRSADTRQLAYEMAVCVCDADGVQSLPEQKFLEQLRSTLGLDAGRARQFTEDAESVAAAPMAGPVPAPGGSVEPPPVPTAGVAGVGVGVRTPNVSEQELDQTILNAAITNGALELLPQSWASMAIIPLQVRMVYGIGQAHGVQLDQGHIREFIAAAGVGITGQYLEQFGRKLVGGLLGKIGGGLLGGLGSTSTGAAFSFATTYALGQVAKRYYAGGRTLTTEMLKDTYRSVMAQAQTLQGQYLPAIQEKARGLDAGKVLSMVRGR